MAVVKLVAVPCKLYPGIFPSERVFEVNLANGDTHEGVAPRLFCWNAAGVIVKEGEMTNGADGAVAGKQISYEDDLPEGIVAVEVPDGEVLAVKENALHARPTKIKPPGVEVS